MERLKRENGKCQQHDVRRLIFILNDKKGIVWWKLENWYSPPSFIVSFFPPMDVAGNDKLLLLMSLIRYNWRALPLFDGVSRRSARRYKSRNQESRIYSINKLIFMRCTNAVVLSLSFWIVRHEKFFFFFFLHFLLAIRVASVKSSTRQRARRKQEKFNERRENFCLLFNFQFYLAISQIDIAPKCFPSLLQLFSEMAAKV